jgi:hypothetical protein
MLYLGIDQHARQITISLRDENGDVLSRAAAEEGREVEPPATDEDDNLIPLADGLDGRAKVTFKRRKGSDADEEENARLAANADASDLLPLRSIDWAEWSRHPLTR